MQAPTSWTLSGLCLLLNYGPYEAVVSSDALVFYSQGCLSCMVLLSYCYIA
ncbi:hypothetical protein PF004_g8975 [Phytophthora fragariae]|uniref:Uncharacterized protein n=1 Tax=Phytophthora fragariae TaxID=53985 RepID=A0A6G0P5C1_9STRA|nr:hypothetical protein PF004_g8975 [Phytophthora fragariae]